MSFISPKWLFSVTTASCLFLWFLCKTFLLLKPNTLFSPWTIAQSMTKSLDTLTFDITSLKTLTRLFVKGHKDIKC